MNADRLEAPQKNSTSDEYTALFTAGTTHASHVVPPKWRGKYVAVTAYGGDVTYLFWSEATEVDNSEAASDAGNTGAKVGRMLKDGQTHRVIVPTYPGGVYFCREASASCTVEITLE